MNLCLSLLSSLVVFDIAFKNLGFLLLGSCSDNLDKFLKEVGV